MPFNRIKCDPVLGIAVHNHLVKCGVETPMKQNDLSRADKIAAIENSMADIMSTLGLDINDDSLMGTPKRIARMYTNEIFWGLDYELFPKCTTVENKMKYDEMVIERDITVLSDCEHHFRPIIGKANIAYIPKEKVLGLSKMPRIVDFFARRPQIQERLTEQIYQAMSFILGTEDVAIMISAEHMCVKQRGIQDQTSFTITSRLGGKFKSVSDLRAEYMSLTKN